MYRAARANGGLSANLQWIVEDQSVPVAQRRYRRPPLRSGLFMLLHAARRRWRYWQGPSSLKSRQRNGAGNAGRVSAEAAAEAELKLPQQDAAKELLGRSHI